MTKEVIPASPERGREFNKLSLVHRVYFACKDGFARLLLATLKDISCEHDRKAIVDQVSVGWRFTLIWFEPLRVREASRSCGVLQCRLCRTVL